MTEEKCQHCGGDLITAKLDAFEIEGKDFTVEEVFRFRKPCPSVHLCKECGIVDDVLVRKRSHRSCEFPHT